MNHHARERVLVLFTGVSDFFFSPRAPAEPRPAAQGPRPGRQQAPGQVRRGQARRLTRHISQMEDPFFFSG